MWGRRAISASLSRCIVTRHRRRSWILQFRLFGLVNVTSQVLGATLLGDVPKSTLRGGPMKSGAKSSTANLMRPSDTSLANSAQGYVFAPGNRRG